MFSCIWCLQVFCVETVPKAQYRSKRFILRKEWTPIYPNRNTYLNTQRIWDNLLHSTFSRRLALTQFHLPSHLFYFPRGPVVGQSPFQMGYVCHTLHLNENVFHMHTEIYTSSSSLVFIALLLNCLCLLTASCALCPAEARDCYVCNHKFVISRQIIHKTLQIVVMYSWPLKSSVIDQFVNIISFLFLSIHCKMTDLKTYQLDNRLT